MSFATARELNLLTLRNQSKGVITSNSSQLGLATFTYDCTARNICGSLYGARQTFSTDKPFKLDWQLKFHKGNVQIQLLSNKQREISVKVECFLALDNSGSLINRIGKCRIDLTNPFSQFKVFYLTKNIVREFGDMLDISYEYVETTIKLIITVEEYKFKEETKHPHKTDDTNLNLEEKSKILTKEMSHCKNSQSTLSKNLETILTDGRLSDATFVIGEQKFTAHRVILSARSPVFASMFEHDMLEKQSKNIPLVDVEPSVFEAFLHFIYTDEKPNVDSDKLCALLVVADRYDVEGLKEVCEYIIPEKLCADNAADILTISFVVNAEYLKEKAMDFVVKNKDKIEDTPAFKNMIKSYSELALEIIKRLNCKKL